MKIEKFIQLTEKDRLNYVKKTNGRIRRGDYVLMMESVEYIKNCTYAFLINKAIHKIQFVGRSIFVINDKSYRASEVFPLNMEVYSEIIKRTEINPLSFSLNTAINYIKKAAIDMYGEDNIELIDCRLTSTQRTIELTIRFDGLTIESDSGTELKIGETFFKYFFVYEELQKKIRFSDFELIRTEVSDEEYMKGFCHPHSSSGNCGKSNLSDFCLGNTALKEFSSKCQKNFNLLDLKMFLISFEDYIKTESTEGVPYKYISELKKAFLIEDNNRSLSDREIRETIKSLDASKVNSKKELTDSIFNSIPKKHERVTMDGESYKINEDIDYFEEKSLGPMLEFKGRDINLRVTHRLSSKEYFLNSMAIPRNLVDRVVSDLLKEFNTFVLNKKIKEEWENQQST